MSNTSEKSFVVRKECFQRSWERKVKVLVIPKKIFTCPSWEDQALGFTIFISDLDQRLHHRLHLEKYIFVWYMYNTSNWKTFTEHYMLLGVFNLYLRWMTATNFFEVEIIFLLLLCANIRDLGMRRLVPEMKRITKVFLPARSHLQTAHLVLLPWLYSLIKIWMQSTQ